MCQEWLNYHLMGTLPGGTKRLHKNGQELNHFFNQSSFAEYAVVNERTAIKVRDDAPLDVVCLLGCGTSTGMGAVINTAGFKAGETIAVFGCGGVGLSAIMAAKLCGADKIFAVDTNDMKLQKAKELGAEYLSSTLLRRIQSSGLWPYPEEEHPTLEAGSIMRSSVLET